MEMLDVFDLSGKHIGVMERGKCHSENPGVYHRAVHIWFINNKGEVLVQKRASFKKQHPDKWDIPSAGHVDAGENLLICCQRETFEELGIELSLNEFKFVCEMLNKKGWEFSEHYLVVNNTKISDMILQKEEVAEVKWLSLNEFKNLLYSDEFVPHSNEYKDKVYSFISKKVIEILDKKEKKC